MDPQELYQPIVVAKPPRAREMLSTVIPKEMLDTMRAVSVKPLQDKSGVEKLKKPREGDVEIYHEGYIDGKLYLVPDRNLEAMRDIINLKMRRRHSSVVKPQTSLEEPTQYTQFTSKLDNLLEKVDKLAESSEDELSLHHRKSKSPDTYTIEKDNVQEKTDSKVSQAEEKNIQRRDYITDSAISQRGNKVSSGRIFTEGKSELELSRRRSLTHPSKAASESYDKFEEYGPIPPLLDENIKYKRVKPKGTMKRDFDYSTTDFGKRKESNIGTENILEKDYSDINKQRELLPGPLLDLDKYTLIKQPLVEEYRPTDGGPIIDVFRLLISGHFKHGTTPIFIIQQNETGSNILGNQIPDFKSHKKDGNIDIFISGKFFTENILEERDDSPAVLNVKPHNIFINNQSSVHRDKFRDVYNLGPVDIALEGEFLQDKVTLKYTPLLSLEITKHSHSREDLSLGAIPEFQEPTTVLFSREACVTSPFEKDQLDGELNQQEGGTLKKHKHVHYAEEHEIQQEKDQESTERKSELKPKGLLGKIMGHQLYKKLFSKSNGDLSINSKSDYTLKTSMQGRSQMARNRRDSKTLRGKSSLKGRKTRQPKSRRLNSSKDNIPGVNTSFQNYRALEETKSPFSSTKGENVSITTEEDGSSRKVHLVKKKKKQDKNQAIIENPILAQMQEFFIG